MKNQNKLFRAILFAAVVAASITSALAQPVKKWTDYSYQPVTSASTPVTTGCDVAYDSKGNIYAAITYNLSDSTSICEIIKYSAGGVVKSTAVLPPYPGKLKYQDYVTKMVFDATDHLYVLDEYRYYKSGDPDNFGIARLLKYNSSLTPVWAKNYDNIDPLYYSAPRDIALSPAGDVAVIFQYYSPSGNGGFLNKYSPAGNLIFSTNITTLGVQTMESLSSIAIDQTGNCIVAGSSYSGNYHYILTTKYGITGTLIWAKTFKANAITNYTLYSTTCVVDGNSNIIIGGFDNTSIYYTSAVLLKYKPGGTLEWKKVNTATGGNSRTICIQKDSLNNIYQVFNTNYTNTSMIKKYDTGGNIIYTNLVPFNVSDCEVSNGGTVYISGGANYYGKTATRLLKLKVNGDFDWMSEYDFPFNANESNYDGYGFRIAIRRETSEITMLSNYYLDYNTTTMHGWFLIRFGNSPSARMANDYTDEFCNTFSPVEKTAMATTPAVTVFPNPSSDFININSESDVPQTFTIFNSQGERVLTFSTDADGKKQINIAALSNGIYFINSSTNNKRVSSFVKQ